MIKDQKKAEGAPDTHYSGTKQADVHANPDREDITPEFARRCLLTALACFLVLLGHGYVVHDRYYLSDGFFVRKYQNQGGHDIVFVGDSRVIRGIDPNEVEATYPGVRAFNFGFSGLGIDIEVLEHAKRLIDPASTVKTIAVAVSRPSLSTANAADNGYISVEHMNHLERANLANLGKYEGLFKLRQRRQIPIQTHKDGFVFTGNVKPNDNVAKRDSTNAIDRNTWVSDEQIAKLAEWVRKTTQEGYRVVSFRVPTSRMMYKVETEKLALSVPKVQETLTKAGAIWLDLPPYREDLVSYDGSHLAGRSARVLSRELAQQLESKLSPSGNVANLRPTP